MMAESRKVIGIRYPKWSSYGPPTMGGVVDFMRGHELWRLVTENDSYGEMEASKLDGNWRGDGLLLFRATEQELAAHRQRGTAVVLTSTEGPDLGYPRVVPDNRQIGALAARHLLECSLVDFAFLARGETLYRESEFAPGQRVYSRERLKGFCGWLQEFAYEPRVHYLSGRPLWEPLSWREIQAEVMGFLETLPVPCGIFAADDALAAVVLRAAGELGRKVPEQLAVIGYGDDHSYCYATCPALSSIVHPAREIGRVAATLLAAQMQGNEVAAGSRIVPVGPVVPRESTDTLAIADPDIRRLIAWIRRTAPHDPVRVAELTEHCRLSLTTIKARFSTALGMSPKKEINRVRLAHLQHLLSTTSETLAEIAERMHFASAHELSRFFTTETGRRPSDFRRQAGTRAS